MNALSQKHCEQSLWVLYTLRGCKETPRTILACLPVSLHRCTATIPRKRNPAKTPHKKMGAQFVFVCVYVCMSVKLDQYFIF